MEEGKAINIIKLMEDNPLTKLNGTYNNKLINKIKENFNEMEQQMFVSSFFCYLNYHPTNDYVIDLDDAWKWLGFSQKAIAKRSMEKWFIEGKDYKVSLYRSAYQIDSIRGGQNRETIMLNIDTFKLFCIKADTKKANEIHHYFVKLEKTLQELLHEESTELKQQLEKMEDIKINFSETLNKEKETEKQKILQQQYGNTGSVVYFIRVKTFEDGKYVIKIGQSLKGVDARYDEHKTNYEECVLLNCVSVLKSVDFERYIHNHEKIRPHKYKKLENHTSENELFLIGGGLTMDTINRIIKDNIKQYNEYTKADFDILEMKIENLELKNQILTNHLKEKKLYTETVIEQPITEPTLTPENTTLLQKLKELEVQNAQIIKTISTIQQSRIITGFGQINRTVGPRLLQINPDTKTIHQIHETLSDCLKESNFQNKRPSIEKAISENLIYNRYRWLYADRNENVEDVLQRMPPSKISKVTNLGYIAKLNKEQSIIITVYLDRKTAAELNGFEKHSALDMPVKNGTIVKDHYYKLFDDCADELQRIFIEQNGLPMLYKLGVGRFTKDGQLREEYMCKYDCIKRLKIGDKTLAKVLDKEVAYMDDFFRSIGSKLQIP
jgi:phage anti-repressor protein